MIRQYTRLVVSKSDNSILHVTSQSFPFADGYSPVSYDHATHKEIDFELDTDFVNQDHGMGVNQEMLRGRQILENFEIVADKPVLKGSADESVSAKVMTISAPKDISETSIRNEVAGRVVAELARLGSSEEVFLEGAKANKVSELSTLKVIRLKEVLGI